MVKSALRTLDILEGIASSPQGATHAELAARLSIPKSSLTGLLRDLHEREYLVLDESGGRFRMGPGVMVLANQFIRRFNFIEEANARAAALCREVNEAVNVTMRDGSRVFTVVHQGPQHTLSAISKVGDRGVALATASGKAIAAFLGEAELGMLLDSWESERPESIRRTRAELIDELAEVRASKIAYSRGEWVAGVIALAAPIFTSESAAPVASISIQLPYVRYGEDKDPRFRKLLIASARSISTLAGGLFPDDS